MLDETYLKCNFPFWIKIFRLSCCSFIKFLWFFFPQTGWTMQLTVRRKTHCPSMVKTNKQTKHPENFIFHRYSWNVLYGFPSSPLQPQTAWRDYPLEVPLPHPEEDPVTSLKTNPPGYAYTGKLIIRSWHCYFAISADKLLKKGSAMVLALTSMHIPKYTVCKYLELGKARDPSCGREVGTRWSLRSLSIQDILQLWLFPNK